MADDDDTIEEASRMPEFTLTPSSATLLSLVAQNPQIQPDRLNLLLTHVEDEIRDEVRKLAVAICERATGGTTQFGYYESAADAYLRWAKENETFMRNRA